MIFKSKLAAGINRLSKFEDQTIRDTFNHIRNIFRKSI